MSLSIVIRDGVEVERFGTPAPTLVLPNLDEIVNKAIPISFPGVKCAATINVEREKALIRRSNLKEQILSLLNDNSKDRPGGNETGQQPE